MPFSVVIPVVLSPNVSLNLVPSSSLSLSKLKDPILPPENSVSTLCDNSVPVLSVAVVAVVLAFTAAAVALSK